MVILDDHEEYEIEQIIDSKLVSNRPRYVVKWIAYDEPTWEPTEYHTDSAAVKVVHRKYQTKLGPWEF